MPHHILTINIGGCGVRMGDVVFEQYCIEHGIDGSGVQTDNAVEISPADNLYDCIFDNEYTNNDHQCQARCVMIDTNADTIDGIKTSSYGNIYNHENLLSRRNGEDSSKNFAKGYHDDGCTELIDEFRDKLRKEYEKLGYCMAIMMNHSVGGGTGSGLTALITDQILSDEYRKRAQWHFVVYPFANKQQNIIEAYNTFLTTYWLLKNENVSFIYDNKQINKLCETFLDIPTPKYNDLNLLIAKPISSMTSHARIAAEMSYNLSFLIDTVIMYPSMGFVANSMVPIIKDKHILEIEKLMNTKTNLIIDGFIRCYYPKNHLIDSLQFEPPLYQDIMQLIYKTYDNGFYDLTNINEICKMSVNSDYFMVEYPNFDIKNDHYIGLAINYHIDWKEFNCDARNHYFQCLETKLMGSNKMFEWAEWIRSDDPYCKTEILPQIKLLPSDTMKLNGEKSIITLGNNLAMNRFISDRIIKPFNKMYSKKAYLHLFSKYKMEESVFEEAIEQIEEVRQNYLDGFDWETNSGDDENED